MRKTAKPKTNFQSADHAESSDVFQKIKETLHYVHNHSSKATWELLLRPNWTFNFRKRNTEDVTLRLLIQLYNMLKHEGAADEDSELTVVKNALAACNDETEFLGTCYAVFEELAAAPATGEPEKSKSQINALKTFKKNIHELARAIGNNPKDESSTRIVNLQKLKNRYKENYAAFLKIRHLFITNELYTEIEAQDGTAGANQFDQAPNPLSETTRENIIKKMKEKFASPNTKKIDEYIALQKQLEEDYAVLKDYLVKDENEKDFRLKQQYVVVTTPIKPISTDPQRNTRKTEKRTLNWISFFSSLFVGIGEGLVAAALSGLAILSLFLIGIPAALCNYFLFRNDSFHILKDIFYGTVWKDSENKPISATKKSLVALTLLFSTGAGMAYGFLSMSSLLLVGVKLGIATSVAFAATPPGWLVFALIIVAGTTIGITTAFAYGATQLIKTVDFSQTYEHVKKFLKESSKTKIIVTGLVHLIFYAVTLALSAIVIPMAVIFFRENAIHALHKCFGVAVAAATTTASVIIGLGSIMTSVFSVQGIAKAATVVKQVVLHPKDTVDAFIAGWKSVHRHPYRKIAGIWSAFKTGVLFACSGINAHGQGTGPSTDKETVQFVGQHVLPTHRNHPVTEAMIFTASADASFAPNALAAASACETTPIVSTSHSLLDRLKSKLSNLLHANSAEKPTKSEDANSSASATIPETNSPRAENENGVATTPSSTPTVTSEEISSKAENDSVNSGITVVTLEKNSPRTENGNDAVTTSGQSIPATPLSSNSSAFFHAASKDATNKEHDAAHDSPRPEQH